MKTWKSNWITKLVTTLAVLPVAFASPAEAFTPDDCSYRSGSTLCMDLISKNGSFNVWEVGYTEGSTSEVFTITCRGKSLYDWRSYGNMRQGEADAFASAFCSL